MYKCNNCGAQSKPRNKVNKVYKYRPKKYKNIREIEEEVNGRIQKKKEVFYTEGFEIEQEMNFCEKCFEPKLPPLDLKINGTN